MASEFEFRPLPETPPLWKQLTAAIRERLHPAPEPQLALESKPIPVKDIWSHERRTGQRVGSVALHVAIIGILMLPFWRPVKRVVAQHEEQLVMLPELVAPGPSRPKMRHLAGGGPPVHQIQPPKLLQVQAPPMTVVPPLPLIPATTAANLPLPALGNIGAVAGPPGNSAGNSGAGPGGAGSGDGGGACVNGPCGIGGDITQPVPIYQPDPEYSDAARKAKYQGTVIVGVIIGTDGHVYDPKIVQALGLGLDQKAIEAVKLWRFKPAERDGRPVRVAANIEVNFHLY
jgi:TonB family protein